MFLLLFSFRVLYSPLFLLLLCCLVSFSPWFEFCFLEKLHWLIFFLFFFLWLFDSNLIFICPFFFPVMYSLLLLFLLCRLLSFLLDLKIVFAWSFTTDLSFLFLHFFSDYILTGISYFSLFSFVFCIHFSACFFCLLFSSFIDFGSIFFLKCVWVYKNYT